MPWAEHAVTISLFSYLFQKYNGNLLQVLFQSNISSIWSPKKSWKSAQAGGDVTEDAGLGYYCSSKQQNRGTTCAEEQSLQWQPEAPSERCWFTSSFCWQLNSSLEAGSWLFCLFRVGNLYLNDDGDADCRVCHTRAKRQVQDKNLIIKSFSITSYIHIVIHKWLPVPRPPGFCW